MNGMMPGEQGLGSDNLVAPSPKDWLKDNDEGSGLQRDARCRRRSCWNWRDVASGVMNLSVQAARSTG